MSKLLSDLLLYPLDADQLQSIQCNNVLFINTVPPSNIREFNDVDYFSYDYADAERWGNEYKNTSLDSDAQKKYQTIFCALPKNKKESFYFLTLISDFLESGGTAVTILSNEAGGKNLSKYMKQIGFDGESHSKSKTRIFVGTKTKEDSDNYHKAIKEGAPQKIELDGTLYVSQAGIFGWDKVDKGSALLVDALQDNLSGIGADFGCGYGFLSFQIAKKYPDIQKLYCMDIDKRAVECAQKNMEIFDAIDCEFKWCDLTTRPQGLKPLDWIIMNPPFHEGKETSISLGQKMIETSYSCLKNGANLYIVANKHLPYERILNDLFRNAEKLVEADGFKVFKAKK